MSDRRFLEDLKIDMLSTGVRIHDDVLASLGGAEAITVHEYATTGGIPLRLGDLYVNAAFDEWYCDEAGVELVGEIDALHLRFRDEELPIDEVFPLPGYVGQVDRGGRRYDEVVFSHLDRIRLSPITGCAYDCAFCDLPGRIVLRPLDRLLEAARVALEDDALPARHALISGGSPGPRQWPAFVETIHALVTELGAEIPVDVMMSSGPETPAFVDQLVDAGVHGFALNIEIESEDAALTHIRGKHRKARPFFDETIARAVSRLGRGGRVRSLILPGLEPAEATLEGVDHLASLGADPVLSPFRPAAGTKLQAERPVDTHQLRTVLDDARAIVASHGVRLGPRCLPCQHNTLTFAWDVA
jgi:uncharacterized radical SAM superfamily protein